MIVRKLGYSVLAIGTLAGTVVGGLYVAVRTGERETVHAPADALIVLGAQVQRNGRPSAALRGRVQRAVALFHLGLAPRIVMTGGVGESGIAEAAAMQGLAIAAGVPESAIVPEATATRTAESASAVGRIAHAAGWRSVIVVSDPFHLRRTAMLFRAEGLQVQTAATDDYYFGPRSRRFYRFREVAALFVETASGEIPLSVWRSRSGGSDDD